MFDLTGKTALVTGATGGIGAAIVRTLHGAGAIVAVSGTRAAALEELRNALGERVHILPCNLADAADVEKLVNSDSWQATLATKGWNNTWLAGDDFKAQLATEIEATTAILKDIGLVQ